MKWICLECPWAGSDDDIAHDGVTEVCPSCGGDVDVDDGPRPDAIDKVMKKVA